MPDPTSTPRQYYDRLTRIFLALGSQRDTQSIHRAVWLEPGMRLADALDTTNRLLLAELDEMQCRAPRIADLGCGVGGSLFALLRKKVKPACAVGLTISDVQAAIALKTARRLGYSQEVRFVVGDYLAAPLSAGYDFVYSIEAFIHARDPARYFAQAAGLLRSGGRLAVCDDFLRRDTEHLTKAQHRMLEVFRNGWQAVGLSTLDNAIVLAAQQGLKLLRATDLTQSLRLRALPDALANRLARVAQGLQGEHTLLRNLLGSMALQQCLRDGISAYHFVVFEKQPDCGEDKR